MKSTLESIKTTTLSIWLIILLFLFHSALAQESPTLATRIKAAFVYKFCHYIDWPKNTFASLDTPIIIAVVGAEDIAQELKKVIAGKTINKHPITLQSYTATDTPSKADVLVIGHNILSRHHKLIHRFHQEPVLIITDCPYGLDMGSSINFLMERNHVHFDISLDSAIAHRLHISSQLLAVTRTVCGREQ